MHINRTLVAVAASTALVFSAMPAHAQRRGDDHARRAGGDREAPARAVPRERPAPRAPESEGARQGVARLFAVPRGGAFDRSAEAPRSNVAPSYPRGTSGAREIYGGDGERSYNYRGERDYRDHDRGYDYRGYNYRGDDGYREYGYHRSFFSFYAFRPRLSLGFGLWVGYPVAYSSYYYYDPYEYAAPYPADSYAYEDPPSPSVAGGVSFEIAPANAAVLVDGTYIGTAGAFSPTTQPLGLTPGRHRIDVRAEGYRTMVFDVDIVAGQVIPYRGVLQPY